MPINLEIKFEDSTHDIQTSICARETYHAFTQDHNGVTHESYVIRCSNQDAHADIYQIAEPELIVDTLDPEVMQNYCTEESRLFEVPTGEPVEIKMFDADDGEVRLRIWHVAQFMYN